jgi:transposase InsO family protein
MCSVLEVSHSGYYEWKERPLSARAQENQQLIEQIKSSHKKSRATYGSPRIVRDLIESGIRAGRNRIARLMRGIGLRARCKRAFRVTTDSNHVLPVALNHLDRNFIQPTINTHWVGDITYIPTKEGWLYLAVVIDLASRKVVGWSMKNRMSRSLVVSALKSAVLRRRPGAGTLFHSDQGSQYASNDFQAVLREHGMIASMSRKGECWDNAVAESFFGTLKAEIGKEIWDTRRDAQSDIFEYVEVWYNRQRRHSTLGYMSPESFEARLQNAA